MIGFIIGSVGFVCGIIAIIEFVEKRKLDTKVKDLYTSKVKPKAKDLIQKVKEKRK